MRLGIFSNRCYLNGELTKANIFIENGKIKEIIPGEKTSQIDYDFEDDIIMAGAIDTHVHINEPGRTEWEGFETATQAAAKGGITTLVDMPLNSSPVTTNIAAFRSKMNAANGQLNVNCGFWAGQINDNFEELDKLLQAGCLGVKVFMVHSGIDEFPNLSKEHLESLMKHLGGKDVPVLAHCEWEDDLKELDKTTSYKKFLASRPKSSEDKAIELFLSLCEKYNCKAHIVHVASSDSLSKIREYKAKGLPLTAETCPHYILFKSEEIEDGNTLFKCCPPIRESENNEQLIQALNDGILDLLATDHSPAPKNLKGLSDGDFTSAWGGISGLQFLISSSWTAVKGKMNLETFIPLITSRPAKFLKIDHRKGMLKEGYDADIAVWNPDIDFKVEERTIGHKHKITPYRGMTLSGKIKATFVNGKLVYKNGIMLNRNCGEKILRGESVMLNI